MTFDLLCLREYENGGLERVLSGVDVTDEDNVDKFLSVHAYPSESPLSILVVCSCSAATASRLTLPGPVAREGLDCPEDGVRDIFN